eukprot:jgi/Botrbrau1/15753/Bobra.4_1s0118.1
MRSSPLARLLLDNNRLSGTIPWTLGHARNLQVINLSNNKLTGSLPATIGALPVLRDMAARENSLYGSIPETFSQSNSLQFLDLSSNRFSRLPDGWYRSTSNVSSNSHLISLYLGSNALAGPFPKTLLLSDQGHLLELELANNLLT